jgi:hypothetical protein
LRTVRGIHAHAIVVAGASSRSIGDGGIPGIDINRAGIDQASLTGLRRRIQCRGSVNRAERNRHVVNPIDR